MLELLIFSLQILKKCECKINFWDTYNESHKKDEYKEWASNEKIIRVPLLLRNNFGSTARNNTSVGRICEFQLLTVWWSATQTALITETISVLLVKWLIPRRPFSCWSPITIAAPPMNPTIVACERKSTMKPNLDSIAYIGWERETNVPSNEY